MAESNDCRGPDEISIAFVGDIHLGRVPNIQLSSALRAEFAGADFVVGNLEGPITERSVEAEGKFTVTPSPGSERVLRDWGVDLVSLANNHMFDCGLEGVADTCRALDAAGIRHLGAGKDFSSATRPLITEIRGRRVGFLAYSWDRVQTQVAASDQPGCAPLEMSLVQEQIRLLKRDVATVVVMPHWGYCDYVYPLPEQLEWADQMLAAGADAVIGHHSHTVQGVACRDGKLVAYSLGDFCFGDHPGLDWEEAKVESTKGLIVVADVSPERISCRTTTTRRTGRTVDRDLDPLRQSELASRSQAVVRPNYSRFWKGYLRRRMIDRVVYWANAAHWRHVRKETLLGGWLMLKSLCRPRRQGITDGN